MKFFNKILMWVISWIVIGACVIFLVVIALHFVRSYERTIAQRPEVSVTIPEGSTMYDIDRILSNAGVLQPGQFIAAADSYPDVSKTSVSNATSSVAVTDTTATSSLEGKLFPDTYDFYLDASTSSVIQKFLDNFNAKAEPLFAADPQDATDTPAGIQHAEQDLILASIVQKEVPSSTDQEIVAGILEKRLADGIPLDVDASICYIKEQLAASSSVLASSTPSSCYPLTAADLKIKSLYNTYLYKGLPPGPIGNPGVQAIEAVLHPQVSPYFYYLSDPKTGETIYATTLAQQNANIAKYLQ